MKLIKSKTNLIINSVEQNIIRYVKQNKSISILLAFSAGPDSSVLLDILFRLQKHIDMNIICAYFDHKLRTDEEIREEILIAQNLCAERGIKLITGSDIQNSIAENAPQAGIEAAARKARYNFLKKTADKYNIDYIAVAHNMDDQIETLIMRFFSGSSIEGLRGIPESNGKIIRPLMNTEKKDIIIYLKENGIKYSMDSTNQSSAYLRNRVRKTLVPAIKEIFPGYGKSLTELSEKMTLADDFIQKQYKDKVKWTLEENGDYSIDYYMFMNLPDYLKIKAIYNVYDLSVNGDERLPFSFVKPVIYKKRTIKSDILLKGYGFVLQRFRNTLFWKTDIVIKNKNSYLLTISKDEIHKLSGFPGKYNTLCFYIEEVNRKSCCENDIWFSPDKVNGSLYIRSRINGDSIILAEGRKKIKKILQESDTAREIRDFIPVICDDDGIIAVWGSVFGYKNRIAARIIDNDNKDDNVLIFRMRQE